MREQLQPHLDSMTGKPEKKIATGFDLYVSSRGCTGPGRLAELQQEWDRSAEAARAEWNEKAKVLEKEQKKAEKTGLDTESDRHSAKLRHEPVGVDRQSRRYWLLKRSPSDWLLTVEISSLKPHEPPPQAYPVSMACFARAWQNIILTPALHCYSLPVLCRRTLCAVVWFAACSHNCVGSARGPIAKSLLRVRAHGVTMPKWRSSLSSWPTWTLQSSAI